MFLQGFKGVWYFIVDTLANWDNLFALLFIALIFVAGDEINMSPYLPVVLLGLNIIIQAIINIIGDYKIKSACKAVNQRNVKKFVVTSKKTKDFVPRTWETLKPGDIIKIKENEEFPSDVLILDCINFNNDQKCFVRGGLTDEFNSPSLKKSHEGT